MDLGLLGRRAIVTGASRGIGAATALCLAGEGAHVGLVGRDEDRLADVSTRCGADSVFAVADLSTDDGVRVGIGECIDGLGGVDILVNNAGAAPFGTIDDITDKQWQEAFDLKVMGYLRGMRAVLPAMRAQRYGRIINIGGVAGLHASAGYVLAALNAALVHLTRSSAEHLGPDGITVVCVHPGPTLTDRLHTLLGPAAQAAGVSVEEFARTQVGGGLPLGRVGKPEEVARLITVVASEVADWITGGGILIDGGAARGLVGG